MRKCPRCKEVKPLCDFGQNRGAKNGKNCYCKPCAAAMSRQRHRDTPEKTREEARRYWLKYLYGITPAIYQEMLSSQGDCCAICKSPGRVIRRNQRFALHVDHCHKTGKVRGLLCHNCNTILGSAGDDVKILEKAIGYLKLTEG